MPKTEKYTIGIIANSENDEGKIVYLTKFINIIKPLSNYIFIITGSFHQGSEKNINVVNIKTDSTEISFLSKILAFIKIQLVFSYNIFKIYKDIDVLIFFGSTLILPLFLAKLIQKKVIIIVGGTAWKSSEKMHTGMGGVIFINILKLIENIGFILSDKMAVESESVVEFLGLSQYKNKISIISNMYLDLETFKIYTELKNRRNLIGFISRLNEGKGVMNFVHAIPLILKQRQDVEFLIGGDGALFDRIKAELKSNGLNDKVRLTGWIPYNEVPKYLNELKLIVFPSTSEGLPNIISESMACGPVILSSAVGGIPDLVKDGKTGFILRSTNPECIAKDVLRLLDSSDLCGIVKNARDFTEMNYTYEATLGRFRKLLQSMDE